MLSMLVVVLLSVQATAPAPPSSAMEISMANADHLAPLWDSARSAKACADAYGKVVIDRAKRNLPLDGAKEPEICEEGRIAQLTSGTQTETLARKQCEGGGTDKPMIGARVLSGKHAGKEGCIFQAHAKVMSLP